MALFPPSVVLQDAVKGTEGILHADFFAFLIGAAIIADANFIDPDLGHLADAGGDFGLKAKAFFAQFDALDGLGMEQLVAGFHIREVEVGKGIAG